MNPLLLFSHGKLGHPQGEKIERLRALSTTLGFESQSLDYTDTHIPDLRAARLLEVCSGLDIAPILVGSSMGAYASLLAAEYLDVKALFLLAPALYLKGYQQQNFKPKSSEIEIVHGWNDETVPFENSIRFAQDSGAVLHLLNSDHGLRDVMDEIEVLFRSFLQRVGN